MIDPRTVIEIHDRSQYTPVDINNATAPTFLQGFFATKGDYNLRTINTLSEFTTQYGNGSAKNGQAFMQAKRILSAGGRLVCKRFEITGGTIDVEAITTTMEKEPLYQAAALRFYSGQETKAIYDIDTYKIDVALDANFDTSVKNAITALANFRLDFMAFLDGGVDGTKGANTALLAQLNRSKFAAFYPFSYSMVIDSKVARLTSCYVLANLLPAHIVAGRNRPFAGINNGIKVNEAMHNTISYIPMELPGDNQRITYSDSRMNYGGYYDGEFILETQFTLQAELTQFSYINNVMQLQELIKAIRTNCPRLRYAFMDGEDFEKYKADVETVILRFVDKFKSIEFNYLQDALMENNKIYYAGIKVSFRNYVESEYFKIFVLG